jgi:phosphoserine aminotransferase
MEMSHRSKEYEEIIFDAHDTALKIYGLGDDYEVLFLQGGATTQFMMVPMNFVGEGQIGNYINTGVWATKALKECKKVGKASHCAATSEADKFSYIPKDYTLSENPAYLHITTNNTIYGTEWHWDPEVPAGVPLIADMSSNFMSKTIDAKRYSLIYAGAQKNMGPAGCTIVLIRKSYLERVNAGLATMLDYNTHAKNQSMHNTPPCFVIYVIGLVQKWIVNQGGLDAVHANNLAKAKYIYDAIDNSNGYFKGTVHPDHRSLMNITFRMPTEELEDKFIKEAKANGMVGLKGHRDVGGCRASTYNSLPIKACQDLATFMHDFMSKNG